MKSVEIYTDGACLGNPGPGGWAAILRSGIDEKGITGGEPDTTNNRMELTAVIEALKEIGSLGESYEVTIYSDSKYVVDGINEWLGGWVAKEFRKVKNSDLWREYLKVSEPHAVRAVWIKGHAGHPENEKCDEMARLYAEMVKRGIK